MPTYPSLQTHKPGEPVDLSNIQYPITKWAAAGFGNEFEHMTYTAVVNNAPQNIKPREGYPGTFPVTQEDIDGWKSERPDLPNIPLGSPRFLGEAVVSLYDNDRMLAMMKEAHPQKLGKAAAWGSAIGASFLDLKAAVLAAVSGGVGSRVATTIGKWGMSKLAASEIFGSKAANIGTQIAQSGITFGAAN